MKKRRLNWSDLKTVLEFKTFLLVIALAVLGVLCIIVEYFVFKNKPDSVMHGVFSEIGIAFITSSTVSLLMEIFLRIDIVDFMTERMMNALPETIKGNTGVSEFYGDRKKIDFKEYINDSDGFMKIIGVSSNDILASANMPIIKKKIQDNPNYKIQILLLSPWSFTAATRAEAPIYKNTYDGIVKTTAVIHDVCSLIDSINDEFPNKADRIELRLYDDIPSLSLVIDSKSAIVAPFMVVEQGGSSPYYIAKKIEQFSGIYDLYLMHFDAIWNNAFIVKSEKALKDLYVSQRMKDCNKLSVWPDNYSDWLLMINNAK